MAKKKTCNETDVKVKSAPEFKPGDKPYCEYDGAVLNANVPWNELVEELLQKGFTLKEVAEYAECPLETLIELQASQFDKLSFRSGARIVTMHCQHRPECYAA